MSVAALARPLDDRVDRTGDASPLSALLTWRQAQAWRALAACTDEGDPGAWHASEPERIAHAVRVCVACPVWRDCLTYALDAGETLGVWAASVEGDARGRARSSGRHRWRVAIAAGETTLDEVLDEHERSLDGTDDDPVPPAFARAVRSGRRGGFGRDVLAHLWRTGRLPEPDEVDLPRNSRYRSGRRPWGRTEAPDDTSAPVAPPASVDAKKRRTEAPATAPGCSCASCVGRVERGRRPLRSHARSDSLALG